MLTFVIESMTPARYGDMQAFVEELKVAGYEKVELINTADGMFMEKRKHCFWIWLALLCWLV